MREDLFKGLTDDQIERARACNSQTELLKMAKAEGVELTNEQLAAINGGMCSVTDCSEMICPKCHSKNMERVGSGTYRCKNCKTSITKVSNKQR